MTRTLPTPNLLAFHHRQHVKVGNRYYWQANSRTMKFASGVCYKISMNGYALFMVENETKPHKMSLSTRFYDAGSQHFLDKRGFGIKYQKGARKYLGLRVRYGFDNEGFHYNVVSNQGKHIAKRKVTKVRLYQICQMYLPSNSVT